MKGWISDLAWGDLPSLAPLLVAGYADPVAFLAVVSQRLNPNIREQPYLAVLADKFPPNVPVMDIWLWAYLTGSSLNDKAAQARVTRAVKAAEKRGVSLEKALYGVLRVLAEGQIRLDVAAVGEEPSRGHRGLTRRKALVAEVEEGIARGVSLPRLALYDVDESVYYGLQDTAKAAMREILAGA